MLKVSVALVTYNGETFIEEQLLSIVNQTVLPNEVVISDDGSTDKTIEKVNSFIEKYKTLPIDFKVIKNPSNFSGIVGNFETALLNTVGDVIFLCDQDDIWLDNKIERMIEVMEDCDELLVGHNAQIIQEQEDGTFKLLDLKIKTWDNSIFDEKGYAKIIDEKYIDDLVMKSGLINGMCLGVKREFFKDFMPISRGGYHDEWMILCAIYKKSFLVIDEVLAHYRIHKNNACGIVSLNKKNTIIEKIKTFNEKGIASIIKFYAWHKDIYENIQSQVAKEMYNYFSNTRVKILSLNKISALYQLIKNYKSEYHERYLDVFFYRDVFFVLFHTKKYRKEFMRKLPEYTRRNYIRKDK